MENLKTIQCPSGISLAYRDAGLGTPILLVHGWGVSGALFRAQFNGLTDRYRLIAPDLPGHGASGAFPANGSFATLADTISALVTQLNLKQVLLVGWSMGAMICWDLLSRHPELDIQGLVTIDMVPRLLSEPGWQHGLRSGSGIHVFDPHVEAMNRNWPEFAAHFVQSMFSSVPSMQMQDLIDSSCAVASTNDPASLAQIWMRMAEQDFRANLRDITIPTLVVAGLHSQLYRVTAIEWVAAQVPRARLLKFSHSGHAPHMEEPERFNRMLSEFVDSIIPRQSPHIQVPARAGSESN